MSENRTKEIEFLKPLREESDKERHNKITERITELKKMVRGLAEDRNRIRDEVIGIFSATAQRIFAHNEHNTTGRAVRRSTAIDPVSKILKVGDVYLSNWRWPLI